MNIKKFNSYSSRVSITLFLASIIPLIIYLYSNNILIENYFSILENKNVESNIEHADKILQSRLRDINSIAIDYAVWDDTYELMAEKDPDMNWVKENISEWLPSNFGVDLVMLARRDMTIIDSYGAEKGWQELFNMPEIKTVFEGKYDENGQDYTKDDFPKGITIYNDKPYILTVSPVLKSGFNGLTRGVLILGIEISPVMLQEIKDKFGYDISLAFKNTLVSSLENQTITSKFTDRILKSNEETIKINEDYLVGQRSITDISGRTDIRLYITQSRDVFTSTMKLLKTNGKSFLFISIGIILLLSYLLKNIIVNPILALENKLSSMAKFKNLEYINNVKGSHEIKSLINSFNSLVESLTAKEHENHLLKKQTSTDDLTSLHNHRYFHQIIKHKSDLNLDSLAVIFMDIDKFKVINDTHGHVVGDRILKIMGKIIKESISDGSYAFRYGGEEFVVLAENVTLNDAYILAENLRSKIIKSSELQSQCDGLPVTVSVGLAAYPEHAKKGENLLEMADRAMYFAKQNGRNQTYIYNENIEVILKQNMGDFRKKEVLLDSALAFAAAIDAKDHYTGKHSEMVTKFSLLLAEKIDLSDEEKYLLRIGALLHDCGKIGIPDNIIGNPGKLSSEEFEIIKKHTVLGNTILKYIIEDNTVMSCVRSHHEKWNGSGYPDALSGENIPLLARIVSLSDAFHAMTSDRPYRKAFPTDAAFSEFRKYSGTQFDPSLVEKFIEAVQESYQMAS